MNTHPNELSLALYAGGELDTPERSGVAAHLAICGECRGTIAEIENVRQLLSSAFPEPTHEDLQLVRKTVSDRVKNSRRGRRLWHWDTAVAAVAGVVKICALLLNRKQPDTALKQEPIQLPSIRPIPRQFSDLSWSATPKQHRSRARGAHVQAGIRAALLVTGLDGSSHLKLITADPNIVILLPLEGETDRHEN